MTRVLAVVAWVLPTLALATESNDTSGTLLSDAASSYVTAADYQVLADAKTQVTKFCALTVTGGSAEIDKEAGREFLEAASGGEDNPIRKMTRADSPAEAIAVLEDINPAWVMSNAWPLAIVIVLAIIYYGGCFWCGIPQCQCCRCMAREKSSGMIYMIAVYASMIPVVVGFIVCTVWTMQAFSDMDAGMMTTTCAAAQLLQDVLGGNDVDKFIGLYPVVENFDTIVGYLDEDSQFVSDITAIIDKSEVVDLSFSITNASVVLLKEMMETDTNVNPTIPTNPLNLLHKCSFCLTVGQSLTPVITALNSGQAESLAKTRSEVKRQFGSDLKYFKRDLEAALSPVIDFKVLLTETLGFFVKPGNFDQVLEYVSGNDSALFFLLLYASLVFGLTMCCCARGMYVFQFKEKITTLHHEGNPYRTEPARMTCCAWNNAMIFAINMFFVGGILVALSAPLSGMCIVLEDFDYAMGAQMMKAFGMNMTGGSSENTLEIADVCLSIKSAPKYARQNKSKNLMDMVTVTEVDGRRTTLRDKVLAVSVDPINAQIDAMKATLGAAPATMSDNEGLVDLRAVFGDIDIKALILPTADAKKDSSYKDMLNYAGTAFGFATGLNCDNYTLPASISKFGMDASVSVRGVTELWEGYENLGTHANAQSNCADGTYVLESCTTSNSETTEAKNACIAANYFMSRLKATLLVSARWRCNVFQDPSDATGLTPCDVKDMYKDSNGVWHGHCLDAEGKSKVFERYCDLDTFNQYVKDWDKRLENVFQYLDDSVAYGTSVISEDMTNYVNNKIVNPIYTISDKFSCTFLGNFYASLVEGMCYQGIRGFANLGVSYVVFAIFGLNLALSTFVVYRRTYDNYTHWEDYEEEEDLDDDDVPAPAPLEDNRETEAPLSENRA